MLYAKSWTRYNSERELASAHSHHPDTIKAVKYRNKTRICTLFYIFADKRMDGHKQTENIARYKIEKENINAFIPQFLLLILY